MRILFSLLFIVSFLSCDRHETDFRKWKSCQDYTVPLFKDDFENKSALLIFPHPDDEITCAGTIFELKKLGWKVNLLTLTQGSTPEEKAMRKEEWKNAVEVLNLDDAQLLDLSNNTWDNVLANKIDFWYDHGDSLERIIENAISLYQPSLLITYDTALGAYGHPEHRMSALAAIRVLSNHREDSVFSVQKILQMTIPQSMENELLVSRESYINAVKWTGNTTLPEPTVAFDIAPYWPWKRQAALEYTTQAHVLRKFYLLPEEEDTAMHYNTFDREYFFEINR